MFASVDTQVGPIFNPPPPRSLPWQRWGGVGPLEGNLPLYGHKDPKDFVAAIKKPRKIVLTGPGGNERPGDGGRRRGGVTVKGARILRNFGKRRRRRGSTPLLSFSPLLEGFGGVFNSPLSSDSISSALC